MRVFQNAQGSIIPNSLLYFLPIVPQSAQGTTLFDTPR